MSDFYIFLEDKGFTEEDIENLSKDELDKYFQEYIESERKNA
jgi:hypothetical protein